MFKAILAFAILGFVQFASAELDSQTLSGTWVGKGVAKENGKILCQEAIVTWKITLDGGTLNINPAIACPATGRNDVSDPIVATLKGGQVRLKYGAITIPGSGGTYTDDTVTATMYVPGALNISAKIGPIKDGVTPIAVKKKGLFSGTLEIDAVLHKQ